MTLGDVFLIVGIVVVLMAIGLYLSMTAGRLDRLHRRIDASRASLDLQLARRQAIALELSASGLLDPATAAVVADAAHAARRASEISDSGQTHSPIAAPDSAVGSPPSIVNRWMVESDLTGVLVEVFGDRYEVAQVMELPEGEELLAALAGVCRRVELTRRFLNDGVRACRQVRRHRSVRWLNLAGRTPWPETVEMNDTPPTGLTLGA